MCPGGGGVTSIYTGTGRAVFWGAFFGAGNKFWGFIFGKIIGGHKFWGIIFCITINFGVLFSKTNYYNNYTLSNCWISAPIMDPSLDIYLQHELNFRVYTLYDI